MLDERWLVAPDGWRLSTLVLSPRSEPRGVAIAGHAMMVDRRTIYRPDRPSLAATVAESGFSVLVPDLRGHGHSGPSAEQGGSWHFDDLVGDMAVYIDEARALAGDRPVVVVGNSLFGHMALAYLGRHPDAGVVALAGFALNIWNRRWTNSAARWALKRALVATSGKLVEAIGYLPARRLGLGSEDEPAGYWSSMQRWVPGNTWDSDEGMDYAAAMSRIDIPVLQVVSEGDRLLCHPDDGAAFVRALPRSELLCLGRAPWSGLAPGHVEMVAHPRCQPLWRWVAEWLVAAT